MIKRLDQRRSTCQRRPGCALPGDQGGAVRTQNGGGHSRHGMASGHAALLVHTKTGDRQADAAGRRSRPDLANRARVGFEPALAISRRSPTRPGTGRAPGRLHQRLTRPASAGQGPGQEPRGAVAATARFVAARRNGTTYAPVSKAARLPTLDPRPPPGPLRRLDGQVQPR